MFDQSEANVGYFPDPAVRNRAENGDSASWTSQALSVHFGYYEAIGHFRTLLGEDEWKQLLIASKSLFRPADPLWLLSKRADGAFDVIQWREHFSMYSFPKRFLLWIIAYFPIALAKRLKMAYFWATRG